MIEETLQTVTTVTRVDVSHTSLLIVDDHLDNVRSLSLLLSESGYRIRKATSGEMALETVRIAKPDLVLLDVRMPEMDGYEVCRRLKANPDTCNIPIIFLSASNETDDKVQAFAVGGADYVTKPFQAEEVLARVRHQITILRQQQQLITQNHQLQQVKAHLQRANWELRWLANTDGLTQVGNRRWFDRTLKQEWQRLRREQQPLSLIFCDIDYFKDYNDRYGHPAGDICLQQVAQAISACVKRPGDGIARYGGEEFAIILPNTHQEGAVAIAEAIRATLEALQIPHAGSAIAPHITLSMGIACLIPTQNSSHQTLTSMADTAMYEAKKQGRDRIVFCSQSHCVCSHK